MQILVEGILFAGIQGRTNAALALQTDLSKQTPAALHIDAQQSPLEG